MEGVQRHDAESYYGFVPAFTPETNIAMSKVVAIMSMSLDGFVADSNNAA